MTTNERLAEAVKRTAEGIAHGAKIRGMEIPADFAIERARNIVMALHELFEDAEQEGYDRGLAAGAPIGAAIDVAITELRSVDQEEP